jgi:translation initiation factor 2 beta subunit (eIF-2beta)/eIF-5
MQDDLKWRREQFAQLRDFMHDMRRNPQFYYFQREALWLGYTAEGAEDIETDETAQAVMHERVYRGVVVRTLQRCISQYVEAGETEERCTNAIAYAGTPWGRIAREVCEEVGQMDNVSDSDADTYVPSQSYSSKNSERDYMSSCGSISTPRISG